MQRDKTNLLLFLSTILRNYLLFFNGTQAPEIDILEAMGGSSESLPNTNVTKPYFSSSLQVSDVVYRTVNVDKCYEIVDVYRYQEIDDVNGNYDKINNSSNIDHHNNDYIDY